MSYIYTATEYENYLKEHHFQDHESRWQNLGELLSIAKKTSEAAGQVNKHYDEDDAFDPGNMIIVTPLYKNELKLGTKFITDEYSDDDEEIDMTKEK